MGFKDMFKRKDDKVKTTENFKMITSNQNGFFNWNGNLYKSDIVRSAIRPKVQAIGKATGTHVQERSDGDKHNPHAHIRFLLDEPNPYMTGQVLQEKLITQLELNNNAFAYINRDENGTPIELYPIVPMGVQVVTDENNVLYLRFTRDNGQVVTFKYSDIIHLRKDFNSDELFGSSNGEALANLMEVVNTTDQGVTKAVKNSNVIQWLLKFNTAMRQEDIKKNTKQFINDFMDIDNEDGAVGAAGIDSKTEAHRVTNDSYVPEHESIDIFVNRIYAFFNTNKNIVTGQYTEDQWVAYSESNIVPVLKQMSEEYTRKLFNRRQRARGHKIVFNSESLSFASMETKLGLTELVDRGAMSINEFRRILNMPPVAHGDEYVRRLDTRPVQEDNSGNGGDN
ncbi:hypothetical protein GCM10028778_11820 [Barrientosiimonas marina]|uniref:Phage portal protein n=1 Tax=Lentibacillus kimchii TaxID=1542911 RepID=A0ABW2UWM5_9BACI